MHLPELVYWASLGELAEVEKSLANGTDVNTADEEGYSALHAAAENGYLDVVKLLVANGANVQHKTQYTALELAEMAGNDDVVAYLKNL
nr:ankyrin repeat domain-containing protein [Acinetobacter sp. YH12069]